MWKRRIQLAKIYKNRDRFYGLVKFRGCHPFIDRRFIDTPDQFEIGPNDPRLQEACKKAWDELEDKQLELFTSGGCNSEDLVNQDDCLHVTTYTYYNTGKWYSAIDSYGKCVICGKTGFKPKNCLWENRL